MAVATLKQWIRPDGSSYYAVTPEGPNDVWSDVLDTADVRPGGCASCKKKRFLILGALALGYFLLSRGR